MFLIVWSSDTEAWTMLCPSIVACILSCANRFHPHNRYNGFQQLQICICRLNTPKVKCRFLSLWCILDLEKDPDWSSWVSYSSTSQSCQEGGNSHIGHWSSSIATMLGSTLSPKTPQQNKHRRPHFIWYHVCESFSIGKYKGIESKVVVARV